MQIKVTAPTVERDMYRTFGADVAGMTYAVIEKIRRKTGRILGNLTSTERVDGAATPAADEYSPGPAVCLTWALRSTWINRKVETYNFRDAEMAHCHTSIDLKIPPEAPESTPDENGTTFLFLPLMWLDKKQLSIQFDLRDEAGCSLRRLDVAASTSLLGDALVAMASGIIGRDLAGSDFPRQLKRIASGECRQKPNDVWRELIRPSQWGLSHQEENRIFGDPEFERWVKNLTERHLLIAVLEGAKIGQQRVLGVDHDVRTDWATSWGQMVGVSPWSLLFSTTASDCTNYHFEVLVPEGLHICRISLVPDPPFPWGAPSTPVAYRVWDAHYGHCVAHEIPDDSRSYNMIMDLRPSRSGWLIAAVSSSLAITTLMFVCSFFSGRILDPNNCVYPETDILFLVTTLFLAAAAAIITIAARAGDHLLTSRLLFRFRFSMWIMVAFSLAAVLILITVGSGESLSPAFCVFGFISGFFSLLFLIALALPRPRDP
ncbi:hypothetical protein OG562_20355 [Streptomyces sp. NBC_01275]|uniref:hypothetical protein n=1 Tax=Streptomyces sp. NBC_01275 TaxID=2903807 RepID=UPI00225A53FA|nr:hypothetical protein [Streptomyces sp. NBC_01275]MCX4763278.1 hypothetical protein [Streptomyces sp. NBC_01275]